MIGADGLLERRGVRGLALRLDAFAAERDGLLIATRTKTHYLDSGLAPNSSHVYQVAAIDAAGNQSLLSTTLSTKTASLGTTATLAGIVFTASGAVTIRDPSPRVDSQHCASHIAAGIASNPHR